MARIDVQQHDLITAIETRLKAELSLDDHLVLITEIPEEEADPIPQGSDFWISISPGDGTFDEALMEGGVIEQCTEDSTFVVAIFSIIDTDKINERRQAILDSDRGMLPLKRKIIKALAGHDLVVDDDDNVALRELIRPLESSRPRIMTAKDGHPMILMLTITFGLMFDWDLTS